MLIFFVSYLTRGVESPPEQFFVTFWTLVEPKFPRKAAGFDPVSIILIGTIGLSVRHAIY